MYSHHWFRFSMFFLVTCCEIIYKFRWLMPNLTHNIIMHMNSMTIIHSHTAHYDHDIINKFMNIVNFMWLLLLSFFLFISLCMVHCPSHSDVITQTCHKFMHLPISLTYVHITSSDYLQSSVHFSLSRIIHCDQVMPL